MRYEVRVLYFFRNARDKTIPFILIKKKKKQTSKKYSGKKNDVSKHMDGFEHLRLNVT